MFDHVSNGTLFAVLATGALIVWLDSRTDSSDKKGQRRQSSLFDYDREPAPAGDAAVPGHVETET